VIRPIFGPNLKFLYICHNIAMQSHLLKNGKICGPLPLLWLLGNTKYFLNNNLKMS
jgi:hypothetical protein